MVCAHETHDVTVPLHEQQYLLLAGKHTGIRKTSGVSLVVKIIKDLWGNQDKGC
jgi:hypothetical protein